jgi:vacuolar-type H+-ATPase subunit H
MLPFFVLSALIVGGAAGFSYQVIVNKRRARSATDEAAKILADAQREAKKITLDAKADALPSATKKSADQL